MRILSTIILLFIVSCSTTESVMSPKYKKLNQSFELITEHEKGMGEVILLDKGEVAYSRSFGPEKSEEAIYRIGSITKTYTAIIILRLIEEGYLSLDTKLSNFYKTIDQADKITIEHLLGHRSGLPNMTEQSDYLDYFTNPVTEDEQLARFKNYKLEFTPGEKQNYSNTGYIFLSYIAQRASSLTYGQLLEKYITKPLNFKKTYLYAKERPRPEEVKGYQKGIKWIPSSNTHESVALGSGAIVSTPKEVALFFRAIFKGKLISQNMLRKMITLKDGYGLGMMDFPYHKKQFFGHTGSIDDFSSIAGYEPEDDVAFAQFINGMATNFNDISISVLASFYEDPFNLPEFKKVDQISDDVLKRYVGLYSGKEFPLKLVFRIEDGNLFGKALAPGQLEVPFEVISEHEFFYAKAGIKIKFSLDGKELEFYQGKTFWLKKE